MSGEHRTGHALQEPAAADVDLFGRCEIGELDIVCFGNQNRSG